MWSHYNLQLEYCYFAAIRRYKNFQGVSLKTGGIPIAKLIYHVEGLKFGLQP